MVQGKNAKRKSVCPEDVKQEEKAKVPYYREMENKKRAALKATSVAENAAAPAWI